MREKATVIVSKNKKECIRTVFFLILAVILLLPSLVITLYSYPCQDDFHYAYYGKEMMQESGYGILVMALAKTVEYYKTFCGCYTSSFLGYFFSGMINCNIWGIRIFELVSALIFYATLYLFIHTFAHRIMGFEKQKILPLYCLLLGFFNGLIYYFDNDDFYWFITSVQYLLILSIILSGVCAFAYSFYKDNAKSRILAAIASVFGFLGSGGTLSIAAFCCALFFLVAVWGVKKRYKESCIVFGIVLTGAVINGIAPGNYLRDGSPITTARLLYALKQSFRYTLERFEVFIRNPIFWLIFVLIILVLFTCKSEGIECSFKFPLLFILFLFILVAGIIFPTILGYGYECYLILNRGIFISDTAFYLFIFLALFYIKGWFDSKYPAISHISVNFDIWMTVSLLIIFLLILDRYEISQVPVIRGYHDWAEGEYQKYSDFCVGIYSEIAQNPDNVAEIHRNKVEDNTTMMNPQFYIGWYDPVEEYANRTIARFYGKEAVYIYFDESLDNQ